MYACMYVCMYVCMCMCVYIHTYIYIYMGHVSTYPVPMYTCVCVCYLSVYKQSPCVNLTESTWAEQPDDEELTDKEFRTDTNMNHN